ncbi:LD-carboxypeptidase [Actinokineospora guangxiensis]|uniref:LD-carboxypeptidase n=1 Tax=Actinokineospora guangxiensis TaxID=1490288 RepID=A0ABW0EI82_9PSEU
MIQPPRPRPGDTVRLVSPSAPPTKAGLSRVTRALREWGLRPQVAPHALDRAGYLAGADADRLADLNDALADPDVRAVVTTRGGKGASRIADLLDHAALRRDPKLLVGFSDATILQLAVLRETGVACLHGGVVSWNAHRATPGLVESVRLGMMSTAPVVLRADPAEPTAALTTSGQAGGVLVGGNLDLVATAAGWALPRLDGAILLLESIGAGLGLIDCLLTMLLRGGHLAGVRGVAVGQFARSPAAGGWTVVDVLRDRLGLLGVPVLGGLPVGHGFDVRAVPVGVTAVLDADSGELVVQPAVS